MLLELQLLNWEEGDGCFWRWPQLHWHTISAKVSFHQQRQGERKEKLTISSVPLCIDSVQRFRDDIWGGSSLCTQESSLSSFGVFSLITGVAFILSAKRRSSKEEHQKGAITSLISWPQTKASRQAGCWRWCISDQRAWSCQQPRLAHQPDCSWIDLSLWSEQTLTAGTVYAKKRWHSEI